MAKKEVKTDLGVARQLDDLEIAYDSGVISLAMQAISYQEMKFLPRAAMEEV